MSGLTQGGAGAPSGVLDEVIIILNTTAAGSTSIAGDFIYDLLRQWATSDLTKVFETGFPTVDTTNFEAEIRGVLLSTNANGFDLDGFGLFNTDSTVLMHSEDTHTAESKSNTDQFTYIVKDRLI